MTGKRKVTSKPKIASLSLPLSLSLSHTHTHTSLPPQNFQSLSYLHRSNNRGVTSRFATGLFLGRVHLETLAIKTKKMQYDQSNFGQRHDSFHDRPPRELKTHYMQPMHISLTASNSSNTTAYNWPDVYEHHIRWELLDSKDGSLHSFHNTHLQTYTENYSFWHHRSTGCASTPRTFP